MTKRRTLDTDTEVDEGEARSILGALLEHDANLTDLEGNHLPEVDSEDERIATEMYLLLLTRFVFLSNSLVPHNLP